MIGGETVRVLWALVAAAVLAVGAVGVWWATVAEPRAREQAAIDNADAFLAALSEADWPAVAARVAPPDGRAAVEVLRAMRSDLEVERARYRAEGILIDDDRAEVDFRADLELAGLGSWELAGALTQERLDGEWLVRWEPAVAHPDLPEGGGFTRSVTWPDRAPILAADGTALVAGGGVVTVGVEPQRIVDHEQVVRALVDVAGADEAAVRALLDRPDLERDWFYPVVELPRARFDEADAQLRPVPGVLFRAGEGRAGPPSGFALHLLGRTGPATAEQAEELGTLYVEGQEVGQFGLEHARQEQLAGEPDAEIAVVNADGELVEVVHRVAGVEPQPVRTTLDVGVQQAAEAALDGVEQPAALVAVDVATGELRAAVSRPLGGFDRALAGRYPPGSTFKVVTGSALLADGLTPDSVVDCPAERAVGGRRFRNAGGLAGGPISLREAMAVSCNTAFVAAAAERADQVVAAARAYGFAVGPDERPDLVLPAFGGSFPEPGDTTELAAAAIGQARVEASPAHMATVAAAAANGHWRSLRLLADQAGGEQRAVPGDPTLLSELLVEVVRSGTGTAAAVPGRLVAGKTGSAEFGTGSPPPTHAWFVGYALVGGTGPGPDAQGVGFAILVEGGGAGGAVAAPLAARFVSGLP